MKILYIDTKDQKIVQVSLKKEGKIVKTLSEKNEYGSQVLLPLVVKLLRTSKPGLEANSSFEFCKFCLISSMGKLYLISSLLRRSRLRPVVIFKRYFHISSREAKLFS